MSEELQKHLLLLLGLTIVAVVLYMGKMPLRLPAITLVTGSGGSTNPDDQVIGQSGTLYDGGTGPKNLIVNVPAIWTQ